ncbi:branched-chain amino acid ABC transporter permease [Streptomyces sp. NPDC050743]|uniref:branched-chain amino acid ABC transporter permease n=1 Tax=Streptomyces sp. NPDC050743 TaxID=3365634 RepID=UPI0037A0CFCC
MINSARRAWLGIAGWVVVLVVLLLVPGNVTRGTQEILLNLILWVGIAQAWNLIGGIGGQLSLGQSAFVGAGGYTLAMCVLKAGTPWPAALLAGGVLSGTLAWLLSHLLLRLSGVYFTIGSSAVALIAQAWMVTWTWTGESRGLAIPLDAVPDRATAFEVIAVLTVVACAVTSVVLRSTFGLRLMAVRDDESAAAALGVPTRSVKRRAFVLSAFLTGLLGGAIALNQVAIEPNSMFDLNWVVTALVMVVVGGMGTVAGPIIGAFVIYYLVDRALADQPVLQALLSGVLVIAVIVVAPNGIVGVLRAGTDAAADRVSRRRRSQGHLSVTPCGATPTEQAGQIPAPLIDQPPSSGIEPGRPPLTRDRPATKHAAPSRESRNT